MLPAVPTEKRQRQKEGRRARLEDARRRQKRRQLARRTVIVVVIAAAVIGTVYALLPSPTPLTAQQLANNAAVAAGCPATPPTYLHPATATKQWKAEPPLDIDVDKVYYATFHTTAGTFVAKLNTTGAPYNANNFIFLAEHGFYNCTTFWRVVPGFVDQGGDETASGSGGPGYTVEQNEFPKAAKNPDDQYAVGALAMANSCPSTDTPAKCPPTNGSQFYVVVKPADGEDGQALPPRYTDFGQVTSGMSVVEKINAEGNAATTSSGEQEPPHVIQRILSISITSS